MAKYTTEIDEEIKGILEKCEISDNSVKITEQLARPIYEKVNKVLVAAGGKWNRGKKVHVFVQDPREVLGLAIDKGSITDNKKLNQQFFTPPATARRLVEIALEGKMGVGNILEPSAGSGNLIKAILDYTAENSIAYGNIIAIEKDQQLFSSLENHFGEKIDDIINADFLSLSVLHYVQMSLIVMNPPFSGGQDVKHIQHAYNFLEPCGRLVAILSTSFQFNSREPYKSFREWFSTVGGQVVEELPEGTFKESGTNIKTVIIKIDKD